MWARVWLLSQSRHPNRPTPPTTSSGSSFAADRVAWGLSTSQPPSAPIFVPAFVCEALALTLKAQARIIILLHPFSVPPGRLDHPARYDPLFFVAALSSTSPWAACATTTPHPFLLLQLFLALLPSFLLSRSLCLIVVPVIQHTVFAFQPPTKFSVLAYT